MLRPSAMETKRSFGRRHQRARQRRERTLVRAAALVVGKHTEAVLTGGSAGTGGELSAIGGAFSVAVLHGVGGFLTQNLFFV
ncbi:hypothetical protein E2562_021799 [Oryza meyeriana var. granulata]|uniref:Uncharacterized protein n=1 Tax=Oryza meyeriana var. granulata TaxID=110450 RepID=A0A6G1ENA9_9ORYZ|nr:hypothetical protein E2562_021799 [Oryza meyeriana var. granulata]